MGHGEVVNRGELGSTREEKAGCVERGGLQWGWGEEVKPENGSKEGRAILSQGGKFW